MEQSQSIQSLAKALCEFQGEVPAVTKDSINPFFKSKYADLSNIIQTARPFLRKNGLSVTQVSERCGECVVITTQLMHISGEWIRGTEEMRPMKNEPQGRGSAITYARRYGYSAILGLATEDDDDGNAAMQRANTTPVVKKVQPNEDGAFTRPSVISLKAKIGENYTYAKAIEEMNTKTSTLELEEWKTKNKSKLLLLSKLDQEKLGSEFAEIGKYLEKHGKKSLTDIL